MSGFGLWGDRFIGSFLIAVGVYFLLMGWGFVAPRTNKKVLWTFFGLFTILQGFCLMVSMFASRLHLTRRDVANPALCRYH
jgi:hypothetical protein